MPGTKKENISLEVDGNIIRIGVREDEGVTEESESPDKKLAPVREEGVSFVSESRAPHAREHRLLQY